MENKIKSNPFIPAFTAASILCVGLFYEWLSAVAAVVLCLYLLIKCIKSGSLRILINPLSVAVAVTVLFYAITPFWAADSGMAGFGFTKFLPILLFLIALMQKGEKSDPLSLIPHTAAVITVVSAVLMQIPALSPYFSVNGRLAGNFMYPNTFALFLLCALIITALKEKYLWLDLGYIIIFAGGILYSGSRTVFILSVISALLIVFLKLKTLKARIITLGGVAALIAVVALISVIGGYTGSIGRFLTSSFTESTFLGRLLYFYDALPVILKNPFGTGYLGFYSLEQSVQTGVYSVRFLHNDLLQLMLDVGWVPALLFVFAVIRRFFARGTDLKTRLLIFVISAHSLFDFDLQFIGIFMLFISVLYKNEGKEITLSRKVPCGIILCVFAVISLYFGTAQVLYYSGNPLAANALYPAYTDAKSALLSEAEESADITVLADEITDLNEYSAAAYSARGIAAFSKGDMAVMMEQMELAIEKAPFSYSNYEAYAYMLINGVYLYEQAGDEQSARVLKNKLFDLADELHSLDEKLSPLGKKIVDQPTTRFSTEYENAIKELRADE